jgi:hypothetical protein
MIIHVRRYTMTERSTMRVERRIDRVTVPGNAGAMRNTEFIEPTS